MKTTKQKSREQFALMITDHMTLGSNQIELCEEDGDMTAIIKDKTSITIVQEVGGNITTTYLNPTEIKSLLNLI
jgi:hypothetical protein